jgi:hypothetical protein
VVSLAALSWLLEGEVIFTNPFFRWSDHFDHSLYGCLAAVFLPFEEVGHFVQFIYRPSLPLLLEGEDILSSPFLGNCPPCLCSSFRLETWEPSPEEIINPGSDLIIRHAPNGSDFSGFLAGCIIRISV